MLGAMFSSRIPIHQAENQLTQLRKQLDDDGVDVIDLAESNPTRVGFDYSPELLKDFSGPQNLEYTPSAFGLTAARTAVAEYLSRNERQVDPKRVVLTATTSEAYSSLFKLLCNPGDRVMVPEPSYPLLEHLARLDGVEPVPYRLEFRGRWEIDPGSLSAAEENDVRAVIAVSPNNPTGSYLSPADHQALLQVCRRQRCALIVDEVFSGYPINTTVPVISVLDRSSNVLTFCLGGLSKAIGLPQVKLSWFVVDGVDGDVESALQAVGFVMDTYLSVSTPVQLATPDLLSVGQALTGQIRQRVSENFCTLERLAKRFSSVSVFPVEGGWYAVMQVPALCSEEQLVLRLLKEAHIYVHPGYFFDFQNGVFLVVSLLPPTDRFSYAMEKVFAVATNME